MIEDEDQTEGLWVTDAQLIRRLGLTKNIGRDFLYAHDRDPGKGFPQKQEMMGNRRYWPAVRAYMDEVYGLRMARQPRITLTAGGRHG